MTTSQKCIKFSRPFSVTNDANEPSFTIKYLNKSFQFRQSSLDSKQSDTLALNCVIHCHCLYAVLVPNHFFGLNLNPISSTHISNLRGKSDPCFMFLILTIFTCPSISYGGGALSSLVNLFRELLLSQLLLNSIVCLM